MPTGLIVVNPPITEPVSLDELRLWLRIDDEVQDSIITSLAVAARKQIEQTFDCALVAQTLMSTYDRFPRYSSSAVWQYNSDAIWQQRLPVTQLSGQWYPDRASIRIPRPPLQSVARIQYVDSMSGLLTTVDPSLYNVDTTTFPGRAAPAFGQIWPIVRQQLSAVQCTYNAGYGPAASVPDTFKTAIKMLVYDWFENRAEAGTMTEGVKNLLLSEWDAEYR
jgi:hypothetical protein